mmetsp:Transcript_37241/g.78015  ORF Transcript_37241/g.78015 Transcript_37241/m.78015 type:complete len:539 (-) Transcript_37241:154-1770(-)
MWGFMGGGRGALPDKFEEQYHCYSAAMADKAHLEQGDKILLPPSAFDILARLQVDYPMLFQLQSPDKGTLTHCGVLEFTAEEGSCVVPFWMMQNLLIEEGAVLTVSNISLPKANYVKFQAQHVDFLEISNPRAVLEHALRNFSCITKGDVICVPYNSKNYHFEIKEVKPQDAACIIETDCNVDFDAPVGYKEPNFAKNGSSAPSSGNGSGAASSSSNGLAGLKKQSAYAPAEHRTSACPSPTPSSLSAGSKHTKGDDNDGEKNATSRTRIVDGKIVHADDDDESNNNNNVTSSSSGSTTNNNNNNNNNPNSFAMRSALDDAASAARSRISLSSNRATPRGSSIQRMYCACQSCYLFTLILTIVLFVVGMSYAPREPEYNVCANELAWKSIVEGMTSLKMSASFDLLVSVYNPNRFEVDLSDGSGQFHHDGEYVGSFDIPEGKVSEKAISDIVVKVTFTPDKWSALSLTSEYYRGNLKFVIGGHSHVKIPKLWNYNFDAKFEDIHVNVNDPSLDDTHLCACPGWRKPGEGWTQPPGWML